MAVSQDFSDLGGVPIGEDYSDLGGVPVQAQQAAAPAQQAPFLQRILPDATTGILNTAQGANRFLTRAVNGALGTNMQPAPQFNWEKTLGAGNTMGDQLIQGAAGYAPVAPLAEAGSVPAALDAAGGLGAPALSRAAQYLAQSPRLTNTLNQIAPNALLGATQSNDPVAGAAQGVALGAAATGIPGAATFGWSKLSNAISPGQLMNGFLGKLGGGASLTNNAKSLAQDIQNAYQKQQVNASALYNPIFSNYSNSNIFNAVNQAPSRVAANNFTSLDDAIDFVNDKNNLDLETPQDLKDFMKNQYQYSFKNNADLLGYFNSAPGMRNTGSYANLARSITENYTPDLNDMHQAFLQNPTLQNAHNLQSQLGASVRDFQGMAAKGNLTTADRINMQNYQRAQNAVLSDTNDFLEAQQPGLGAQYTAANANYAQNVAPYKSNPAISKIATGDVDYPKNINTIFAKPTAAIQKIVQDLGPSANDKILYNQLGTPQNSATPEKLQAAMMNLDKQGLSNYLTPDHLDFQTALNQKITNRNTAQHVAGMLGGAVAAHPLGEGFPGAAEIVGGMIGNSVLPPVIRGIQKILPLQKIANAASKTANVVYPPLRNAAIGNYFQPQLYPNNNGLGAPIAP